MKKWIETLTNIVLTVTCAVVVVLNGPRAIETLRGSPSTDGKASIQNGQTSIVEDVNSLEMSLADRAVRGDALASIVLIEFSDYQCPYCGRYQRDTYAEIEKNYISTGKVKYTFRNFPLEAIHPFAFAAGKAAECAADQGHFWEMRNQLFGHQEALDPAGLFTHARAAGVDIPQFEGCLTGSVQDRVRRDMTEGKRVGVSSTPTFLIGRVKDDKTVVVVKRIHGAQPLSTFEQAIESVLKSSGSS